MEKVILPIAPNNENDIVTYLHRKNNAERVPLSGTFELTGACNFNCKMCYVHSAEKNTMRQNELTASQWLDIASQARDKGMLFLLLTGGEPMIREDFAEIYDGLSKMGFILHINTNASLISEDIFSLFARSHPTRVNVSLYGMSEDTYENLCENRSFIRVKENILRLKEMGITVVINCSLTGYNAQDYEKVADFARSHDINIKTATYLYPALRIGEENIGGNGARLTPEDAAKYRFIANKLYLSEKDFRAKAESIVKGSFVRDDDCIDYVMNGGKIRCRAGKTSFWVEQNGNMSPCGMIPADDNNVLVKGFDEAWKACVEKSNNLYMPKKCLNCRFSHFCSVCPAAALTETGSFAEAPDYICRMNECTYKLCSDFTKDKP